MSLIAKKIVGTFSYKEITSQPQPSPIDLLNGTALWPNHTDKDRTLIFITHSPSLARGVSFEMSTTTTVVQ